MFATEKPGFSKSRAARTSRAHRQVAFGRREAARERSGSSACSAARRAGAPALAPSTRAPATRKSASKNRQQSCGTPARSMASWPERLSLNVLAARREQIVAQLAPSIGVAHVDELAYAGRSERQHGLRRRAIELREQRDGGHAREFPDERRDAGARAMSRSASTETTTALARLRLEILNELRRPSRDGWCGTIRRRRRRRAAARWA